MYALVEAGGKQYKVTVGQIVDVERLLADVGETIDLDRVLLVCDGEAVQVGRPILEEAKVSAMVMDHGKGDKVIVFKYRPKQRYRVKRGHRQEYTRLRIDAISA